MKKRFQNLPFKFNLQRYILGADLIELIAMEVGKEVEVKEAPKAAKVHGSAKAASAEAAAGGVADNEDDASPVGAADKPRRAVVAVMGHVVGLCKLNQVDP